MFIFQLNPNLSLDKLKLQFEPQPEQMKDLLDFWFKSAAYTEDPYDFSKEFNIGDLYRDRIKLKNHIRAYAFVNKFNLEHVLSNEYKIVVHYKGHKCSWRIYATRLLSSALFRIRGSFEYAYQLLTSYFAKVRLVDPNFVFDIQTMSCKDKRFTRFVVISDRNPEIINVVPKVFPFAIHTFCAFHILNNIKTTLESTRIAFRMAAEALTSIDFDKHMNVIQNTDPVGLQYILGIPKKTWSNLYIPMSRYGVAYTNHVESWNKVILKVKYLPIHVFIEKLCRICSKMSYTYREEAEKSQARITPWATDHCESGKFETDSLTYRVRTSRYHFQMTSYGKTDSVNIEDGTCFCRWWQTMGIHCEHGERALGLANVDPTTRVFEYFTNNTYKAIYEPIWIPIRGFEQWKILKTDPRVCAPIPKV
ncbi:hypothetical protein GIB67_017504 [Kingdonia uniflora]|uniref:SWIM-type domain-containing protein n=1 Tax=Kingdonia uniflora TaxID=39325 RepID=A0A7J7M4E3_9MAGN|nr:hypothetical protein GIB67_017504 [Kingdonia uniflora]